MSISAISFAGMPPISLSDIKKDLPTAALAAIAILLAICMSSYTLAPGAKYT